MKRKLALRYVGLIALPLLLIGTTILCGRDQLGDAKITPEQALRAVRRFCRDPRLKWVREEADHYSFVCGEDRSAEVDRITGQVKLYHGVERRSEKVRLTIDQAYKMFVASLPERGVTMPTGMCLTRVQPGAGFFDGRGVHYMFEWRQFVGDVELYYSTISAFVNATDGEIELYDRLFDTVELKQLTPQLSQEKAVFIAKQMCPFKEPKRLEDVHLAIRRQLPSAKDKSEAAKTGTLPGPGKQILTWSVTLRGLYVLPYQMPLPDRKPIVQDYRMYVWINALNGKVEFGDLEQAKDNDLQAVERLSKIPLPSE